jgi:hypothetical protein
VGNAVLVEFHRQHEDAINPALLEKADPARNDRPRDVSMVLATNARAVSCFCEYKREVEASKLKFLPVGVDAKPAAAATLV